MLTKVQNAAHGAGQGANPTAGAEIAGSPVLVPAQSQMAFLKNNLREYGMLMSLVVIMGLFQYLTGGTLLSR